MDAKIVLKKMIEASNKSQRLISVEIGRHPTYIASLLHGGSYPQIDTFTAIAQACGCQVIVRFPEEEQEVDGWNLTSQADAIID
ncbi:MAG: helix-turn-helix transcriptional regulator [Atopobiaceae bacterium]|nr:helix-turn-helix transcriptional regulator [Atopobiaceae bacterium]